MINTETDSSIHFSIHKVQQQPCSHWSTIQETQQGFCTSLYHRVYMGWLGGTVMNSHTKTQGR